MPRSTPQTVRILFPVTEVDLGPPRHHWWRKLIWSGAIVPALIYLSMNTRPGTTTRTLVWMTSFGLIALAVERLTVIPPWIKNSDWKLWHIERGTVKPFPDGVRYTFKKVIAVHQDMYLRARVSVLPFWPRKSVWIRLQFEKMPSEKTVQLLLGMREELLKTSTVSLEMTQGSISLPSFTEPYGTT